MTHILGSILHTSWSRTYHLFEKKNLLTLIIFAFQLQLWNLKENLCDVIHNKATFLITTFPNLSTLIQNSIRAKSALRIQIFPQYTNLPNLTTHANVHVGGQLLYNQCPCPWDTLYYLSMLKNLHRFPSFEDNSKHQIWCFSCQMRDLIW